MSFPTARLVRRMTEDGLVTVEDHVPEGKVYEYVPESTRVTRYLHFTGVEHEKVEVWARTPGTEDWGWVPVEMLEFDEPGTPASTKGMN